MATHLFTNGKIFQSGVPPGTNAGLHGQPTFASCMLTHNSQILHIGAPTDAAITTATTTLPPPTVHDLRGRTILPGFVDGHMHLMLLGQALNKLDLGRCANLSDIQAAIRAHAAANPAAPRLLARGWMHSMTPAGRHATDLDGLDVEGRDRPVLVDSKDLHSTWCNSAGVEELGAEGWVDVPGGVIERDGAGRVTGVFSEAANITYVWPYLASVASMEERVGAIEAAVRAYHEAGYTGMVDMAMDEGGWDALLAARRKREGEGGALPMRIAAYWLVKPCEEEGETLQQVERAIELAGEFNAETTPDCRIVGIKPYAHNGHTEVPLWTAEQLEPVVKKADEAGLQIALHAIGDATMKMVVDILTKFARPGRRPRVEHLELTTEEDVARLGKGRITASIQPVHADPAILKAWPKLLG
ncbi:hypothetical protein CHGG_01284 [Chaetomium globosum CBS 148.51]|uniref:Amidohydrolase 3 domain-containing protein n=1 Tax=Chaetomium globosum (strain ATCC 6205 / CBS 148.51 / DSM 1962 / NBRC 6347 / NRRL 1970) TaxID=306901 RepID=Q2HES0_CHAGB|nr:uncharacterized protein CHGG_01284 [Chaetomium globosum CBS 148.51]EAQ93049.1 hypothetical protein CHGG_01284 [Chaetomium globosum CBS 148.51]